MPAPAGTVAPVRAIADARGRRDMLRSPGGDQPPGPRNTRLRVSPHSPLRRARIQIQSALARVCPHSPPRARRVRRNSGFPEDPKVGLAVQSGVRPRSPSRFKVPHTPLGLPTKSRTHRSASPPSPAHTARPPYRSGRTAARPWGDAPDKGHLPCRLRAKVVHLLRIAWQRSQIHLKCRDGPNEE